MSQEKAFWALDHALFGNVFNMRYDESKWEITFEGENYVVWDLEENELHHFRVAIEPFEWDSTEARRDQEWDI